jgi:uncharacterized membrane protein HdeD (DUF308 family)
MLVPAIAAIGGILCLFDPAVSLLVYILLPAGTYLLGLVPAP